MKVTNCGKSLNWESLRCCKKSLNCCVWESENRWIVVCVRITELLLVRIAESMWESLNCYLIREIVELYCVWCKWMLLKMLVLCHWSRCDDQCEAGKHSHTDGIHDVGLRRHWSRWDDGAELAITCTFLKEKRFEIIAWSQYQNIPGFVAMIYDPLSSSYCWSLQKCEIDVMINNLV